MENIKFTLTFTGEVSPDAGDPDAHDIAMTKPELINQLEQMVKNALSNGWVTGDSPATLEDYAVNITIH